MIVLTQTRLGLGWAWRTRMPDRDPASREQSELWVGSHPKKGLVVYDERSQIGVSSDWIRLFVAAERKMVKFRRDIFLPQLSLQARDAGGHLAAYEKLRARSRSTHCYECGRDLNAVDFSICERCGWISCECTACGCDFRGKAHS